MRKNKVLGLSLALGGAVATIAATFALYVVNPDNNRIHISVDTGQTEQVNYVVNIPSDQQNVASLKFDGSAPHNVSFSVGADVLEDKVYGQKAIQSKLEVSITGEVAQYLTLTDLSVSGYDASSYASGLKASATSGESRVYTLDVPLLIASDLTVSFSVNLPAENGKSTLDENVVVGLGNTDYAIEISLQDVEEDKQVFLTGSRIGDDAFRMAPDLESSSEGYIYENISLATTDEISAKKGSIVAAASSLSSGLYSPSVDGNHTIRWNATATDGLHGTPALNGESTGEVTPPEVVTPEVTISVNETEVELPDTGSVEVSFEASTDVGTLNTPTVLGPSGDVTVTSSEGSYTFTATEVGNYVISATATNEDKVGSDSVTVSVVDNIPAVTPDPVETTTLYARVPSAWGENIQLHAWNEPDAEPSTRINRAIHSTIPAWPGLAMELVDETSRIYKVEIENTALVGIDSLIVHDKLPSGTATDGTTLYSGNQTETISYDGTLNAVYVNDDGRALPTSYTDTGIVVPTFPELPAKDIYVYSPEWWNSYDTRTGYHSDAHQNSGHAWPGEAMTPIDDKAGFFQIQIPGAEWEATNTIVITRLNVEGDEALNGAQTVDIAKSSLAEKDLIVISDTSAWLDQNETKAQVSFETYATWEVPTIPEAPEAEPFTFYAEFPLDWNRHVSDDVRIHAWGSTGDLYGAMNSETQPKMTIVESEERSVFSYTFAKEDVAVLSGFLIYWGDGQTSNIEGDNLANLRNGTNNLVIINGFTFGTYTPTQEGGDLTPDQGGDETPEVKYIEQTYSHSLVSDDVKNLKNGDVLVGGNTEDINGLIWTLSAADYCGYSSDKGLQIGSGNKPAKDFTISTSFGEDVIIKGYTVKLSGASNVKATYSVSFGNHIMNGAENCITSSVVDYSETGLNVTANSFVLNLKSTLKAVYIKTITLIVGVKEGSSLTLTQDA